MKDMLDKHNKKVTIESVIFTEDEQPEFNDTDFSEDAELENDDFEDEEELGNEISEPENVDSSVKSEIDKIREISLKAIVRLAKNPNSPEYDLMKKIWNLCDKTVESKKENNV